VADRQARLPLESHLVRTAKEIPTIVVYAHGADLRKLAQLNAAGVKTWCCNSPQDLLARAGKEKIDGILLEGGGTLNEAFLREGLVDEVYAFIAPKLIGGIDAKTPVEGLGLAKMSQAMKLHDVQVERIGEDLLVRGLVKKGSE
jgi:diaminohydroxyphosphoribosylaminopyrimidine deaminase/5-amino-6-(5-phosphoribosylamino)uracil reductase